MNIHKAQLYKPNRSLYVTNKHIHIRKMKIQILISVVISVQAASIFSDMTPMGGLIMTGESAPFASDLYSIFRSDGFNSLRNNQDMFNQFRK